MKRFLLLIILVGLLQTANSVLAESNQAMVPCDINAVKTGEAFTRATITVTSLDTSGSYIYMGIDAGIFEKPSDYDPGNPQDAEWKLIYMQRVYTDKLNVEITDFGDTSVYKEDKVYVVGYRIIYRPSGPQTNPIVEIAWRKVDGSYFKLVSAIEVAEFTDRVTGRNNWKTEEEIARYNWYNPGSEVVCKLVIKPQVDADSYEITMDANVDTNDPSKNNNEIQIKDLRIVRVDIGGNTKAASEKPPLLGSNTDTIKYSINLAEADKRKDIIVYYKYTFTKKPGQENVPLSGQGSQLMNKATAAAVVNGSTGTIEKDNKIVIKDIKVIVR